MAGGGEREEQKRLERRSRNLPFSGGSPLAAVPSCLQSSCSHFACPAEWHLCFSLHPLKLCYGVNWVQAATSLQFMY